MKPEAIQNERDRIGSTKRTICKQRLNNNNSSLSYNVELHRKKLSSRLQQYMPNEHSHQTDTSSLSPISANSETDESSNSLSTPSFVMNIQRSNSNDENQKTNAGLCSMNIIKDDIESAQSLNSTLMAIDEHVRTIWDHKNKDTQRQRIVKNLLEWASLLYPLPTLPFHEKV